MMLKKSKVFQIYQISIKPEKIINLLNLIIDMIIIQFSKQAFQLYISFQWNYMMRILKLETKHSPTH